MSIFEQYQIEYTHKGKEIFATRWNNPLEYQNRILLLTGMGSFPDNFFLIGQYRI